jgi:hypothetical protein
MFFATSIRALDLIFAAKPAPQCFFSKARLMYIIRDVTAIIPIGPALPEASKDT